MTTPAGNFIIAGNAELTSYVLSQKGLGLLIYGCLIVLESISLSHMQAH